MALEFAFQHQLIYHPRPYRENYRQALPVGAEEIESVLPCGRQVAFYLPPRGHGTELPHRVWVAFSGNASLALDWLPILPRASTTGDAFLLIDYPGYGKSAGRASIANTRAAADAAVGALARRLGLAERELEPRLSVLGHSLGAAAALDFAAHHGVGRAVLSAPFTSLREEAGLVAGRLLACLLRENYDNRASLARLAKRNPRAQVTIFHGTDDTLIPVTMSRQLAAQFPATVTLHEVPGADHNSILSDARDELVAAMER